MEISSALFKKFCHGGFWVGATRVAMQVLAFIRTIVTARLLLPSDFGVLAIASIVIVGLERFTTTGFSLALVREQEDVENALHTAWTLGVIRGFLIYVCILVSAPWIASFFADPMAEKVLQVIGITCILNSLQNIALLYYQKELKFKELFWYRIIGSFVEVCVTLTVVYLTRSVWGLVAGTVARSLTLAGISYVFYPFLPRLEIQKKHFDKLFNFGKWIYATKASAFFTKYGDNAAVGKMLGTASLGYYQMAYRLANLPLGELTQAMNGVLFPVYAKLQSDSKEARTWFFKLWQWSMIILLPIASLMILLAKPGVAIILGFKWTPMVLCFQILVIFAFVRSLNGLMIPLFQSHNKADVPAKTTFLQLCVIAVSIIPLTYYLGIEGAAVSVSFSSIACFLALIYRFQGFMDVSFKDFFKSLRWIVLVNILVTMLLYFTLRFIDIDKVIELVLATILFITAYIVFLLAADFCQDKQLIKDFSLLKQTLLKRSCE